MLSTIVLPTFGTKTKPTWEQLKKTTYQRTLEVKLDDNKNSYQVVRAFKDAKTSQYVVWLKKENTSSGIVLSIESENPRKLSKRLNCIT